jgi:hypothetical protein
MLTVETHWPSFIVCLNSSQSTQSRKGWSPSKALRTPTTLHEKEKEKKKKDDQFPPSEGVLVLPLKQAHLSWIAEVWSSKVDHRMIWLLLFKTSALKVPCAGSLNRGEAPVPP